MFYGDVMNNAKLVKSSKNRIREGYELATIVESFWQVYFPENVDNLLVQLVGSSK